MALLFQSLEVAPGETENLTPASTTLALSPSTWAPMLLPTGGWLQVGFFPPTDEEPGLVSILQDSRSCRTAWLRAMW
jgi:hypothetical protein